MTTSLATFIVSHNLTTTIAGVTIGFSAGVAMRSLVGDVLLPLLHAALVRAGRGGALGASVAKLHLDVGAFVKELLTFLLVVAVSMSFVLLTKRWAEKTAKAAAAAKKPASTAASAVAGADAG